ncbi:MAG: WD40/YVTN/BNR-like repeat-containing protein [Vicinamibacteria bacterium]
MRGRARRCAALAVAAALWASPGAGQTPSPGKEGVVTSLTIFAGTTDGLRRSRNWGNTWEPVQGKGLEDLGAVRAIVPIAPRVYVGGDGGLYLSEDVGETWKRIYSEQPILEIVPSRYPLADLTVFVATPRGLLRSDDAARTFRPQPLLEGAVHRVLWPGPDLVLATNVGVRVSKDSAASFLASGAGLPEGRVSAITVSAFYSVDPALFAAVTGRGVFRSADGAQSWTPAGLDGRTVNDLYWFGPILYAATDGGFLQSEDQGRTWVPRNEGLRGRTATRILFPLAPVSGAEAFLGTDRGVFWTGDGGLRWRATGLDAETILCLATFPPPDPVFKKKK